MTMPVNDDQVAVLHALLTNDVERHKVLYSQLDRAEARTGYTALVAGAFSDRAAGRPDRR